MNDETAVVISEGLFFSPKYYLYDISVNDDLAFFFIMDRDSYSNSSFLDHRTVSLFPEIYSVSLHQIKSNYINLKFKPRRMNFIFHTAFCGSTLLCRCLDKAGACLPLKEPYLLHKFCTQYRQDILDGKTTSQLLNWDLVLSLLSRTFYESEISVIKPTDSCINLARKLLQWHPEYKGILLYDSLDNFLISTLKNPTRRSFVRGNLMRSLFDLNSFGLFLGYDIQQLNDAQGASLTWLSLMRYYMDLLQDATLNLLSLQASSFFSHPRDTLFHLTNFFDLSFSQYDLDAIFESNTLYQHAKEPSLLFSSDHRNQEMESIAWSLSDEIIEGVAWAMDHAGEWAPFDGLIKPVIDLPK